MEERTSAGKNSNRYSGFGQGKHEKEGGIQVRGNQWGCRTGAEASGGLKRGEVRLVRRVDHGVGARGGDHAHDHIGRREVLGGDVLEVLILWHRCRAKWGGDV